MQNLLGNLSNTITAFGQKVKDALPKTPMTDGSSLQKSLALPSDTTYNAAGGRRRNTRKAGKRRKTRRRA
jgi:hypothetical protein